MSQHIHEWLDLLVASTENKWPKMCGLQKRQRNIGLLLAGTSWDKPTWIQVKIDSG